ncbi:MAG: DUF2281 domain-containing protein [Candidatus Sericytochromatia bacterium]|nr:DUF2281 domain-containing protein [Candidatus Sericytochromatia bacterium]
MFQDQEILNELHSLPPAKQAEVVDFIQFLKYKQQTPASVEADEQQKLQLAAELLLSTPSNLDPEEIALWDAVVNASDEPVQIGEPDLRDYD